MNEWINKKTCRIVNFTVPADLSVNIKENEKRDKYLDLARIFKKLWNMRMTMIPIVIIPQKLVKGAGRVGNWRMNWDRPNYGIVEISQHTEKSPGDLRRLTAIQTLVKDHQLTLMWKTQVK